MRNQFLASVALIVLAAGCSIQKQGENQPSGEQAAGSASWNQSASQQLREAIDGRAAHGLDQKSFGDGEDLSKQALEYAKALSRGAVDPEKLYEVYTVPKAKADKTLEQGLAAALQSGDVKGWLNSLAPQDPAYQKLSQAYLALRLQPGGAAAAIPDEGELIKPGATDPRVPEIARQLVILDYLPAGVAQGNAYTPAMAAAVKKMQADYGMNADGVIGQEALAILNMSNIDRARAFAVAMERMRWLERDPPKTRIDVNLAAARLTYWRDGEIADSRKVVVGEPDKETPQLGSPIYQLVANPTWTVPRSIQEEEIAPKGEGYLKANNMVWKDGWIVQQPGPKNSLGLVKFDMKNDHAIYLHDTPAKALFGQIQRQRSHGCVRVEDALGFAEMLARDQGITQQWQQARAKQDESFVKLPSEIPVRLLYLTVLFDEAGEPIVRNDPYGWDDKVGAALGFKAGKALRVRQGVADVGP